MKLIVKLALIVLIIASCNRSGEEAEPSPINWRARTILYSLSDTLVSGTTYLPVYSEIYHQTEHRTYKLTVTVSIRNTSGTDTLFIENAEYFNTRGTSIRSYVSKPVYVAPMETIEIVIPEKNSDGGTGANFIFDWRVGPATNEPLFEAVMISTHGQQGISYTTRGVRID